MTSFTLIITYILLGVPNGLIIPGFTNKTDYQIQVVNSVTSLKSQGAKVDYAICHRVTLNLGK